MPKPGGGFPIQWDDAFLDIDDEDNDMRGLDRQFDLFEGGFGDNIRRFFPAEKPNAASIHQRKGATTPFGFGHHAIACNAGLIMNDRNATPHDAIEQRGLPDIRTADDGD